MSGLFEHLAAFDDSERVAARQAVAVARKRVQDRFGAFLSATTEAERNARIALIENDLNEVVASVVEEYGGDYDKVRAVIADWTKLPRDTSGQWTNPDQLEEADQGDIDTELAKAPSAVGADAGEGVLSHTAGNPLAPGGPSGSPVGDPEYDALKQDYKYEQGMDKFGHPCPQCGMSGEERRYDPSYDGLHCPGCGYEAYSEEQSAPRMNSPQTHDFAREQGLFGSRSAADTPQGAGGAVKRESLPKADASGLGGPSPKIDKGKSGDETGWNLKPIDTQMKGSPHSTDDQDVTQKPEFNKNNFLDQTDTVTESVELDTADDWGAGFASGGEEHGPNTDTWTEAENDPVTSDRGEGVLAATDPDKNPISEIMSSWEDDPSWESDRTVQAAIWQYEQGESNE